MCVYECVRRSLSLNVCIIAIKNEYRKKIIQNAKKIAFLFPFQLWLYGKRKHCEPLISKNFSMLLLLLSPQTMFSIYYLPSFSRFCSGQTNKQTNETILFRLLPFLFVKTNWLKSNANASITESEALQSKRAMFAFLIEKILFIFAIVQCAPRNTNWVFPLLYEDEYYGGNVIICCQSVLSTWKNLWKIVSFS